jgi:hypothetical protein
MVRYYGLYANAHIHRSPEANVCGGRGERQLYMIISFSPEGKAYRLLAGARGFFALTCFFTAAYCSD